MSLSNTSIKSLFESKLNRMKEKIIKKPAKKAGKTEQLTIQLGRNKSVAYLAQNILVNHKPKKRKKRSKNRINQLTISASQDFTTLKQLKNHKKQKKRKVNNYLERQRRSMERKRRSQERKQRSIEKKRKKLLKREEKIVKKKQNRKRKKRVVYTTRSRDSPVMAFESTKGSSISQSQNLKKKLRNYSNSTTHRNNLRLKHTTPQSRDLKKRRKTFETIKEHSQVMKEKVFEQVRTRQESTFSNSNLCKQRCGFSQSHSNKPISNQKNIQFYKKLPKTTIKGQNLNEMLQRTRLLMRNHMQNESIWKKQVESFHERQKLWILKEEKYISKVDSLKRTIQQLRLQQK